MRNGRETGLFIASRFAVPPAPTFNVMQKGICCWPLIAYRLDALSPAIQAAYQRQIVTLLAL